MNSDYQYINVAVHNGDVEAIYRDVYDLWRQRLYKAVEAGDFAAAREITYQLGRIKEDHKATLMARDIPAE